jgi:chromosome partitioning protein
MLDVVGRDYSDFSEPKAIKKHGPARIISLCNQKGGVGKTTTSINLAAAFAGYGRKVLLIDFDPQAAATAGLGISPYDAQITIYNVLMERATTMGSAILPTKVENLDLVPANIDLSAAEVQLVNEVARETILERAIREVENDYDVILIDCQPSLGLLAINALAASNGVLIPLAAEFFALRGVALLIETIDKIRDRLNPRLSIDGILITMFDSRTLHSQEVVVRLFEAFSDDLLHTSIPRTIKFPDATIAAEPITTFAPTHKSAKAYLSLARELISRGAVA